MWVDYFKYLSLTMLSRKEKSSYFGNLTTTENHEPTEQTQNTDSLSFVPELHKQIKAKIFYFRKHL